MTSDINLARASRDAYNVTPEGTLADWEDMRAVTLNGVLAIRGTSSWANMRRDLFVHGEASRTHPTLGKCCGGILDAAEHMLPLIGTPRVLTGHSLGGWCAILLAGLLAVSGTPPELLVTFDAPKAGMAELVSLLSGVTIRQYRFRGSFVTDWPLWLNVHCSVPLIDVGDWVPDPVRAHSIDRACGWMGAHLS